MKSEDVLIAKDMLVKRLNDKYFNDKVSIRFIDNLISNTIINEEERLKKSQSAIHRNRDIKYWRYIKSLFYRINYQQKKDIINDIIKKYFDEIAGKFNQLAYDFVYHVLNNILPFMFSKNSILSILNPFLRKEDQETIEVKGKIETIQKLEKKGTIVLVPTHSSNLDSMITGLSIGKIGLPPFLYGAGINLYSNPILAFFMEKIGAYTIDREKSNIIYKDVLKEFATITMELGYHNIFFPNGGRTRSNILDNNLKLGLLGSAFNAYLNNIKNKNPRPNIYIIPATINYHITLEAKTMIQGYLKKTSPNIIIDDETSKTEKISDYLLKTLSTQLKAYFNIANPMDVFGNTVDMNGNSLDKEGHKIDITRYLFDENRKYISSGPKNSIYVKNLGKKIVKEYYKNNIVFSNILLSFVVYELAKRELSPVEDDDSKLYILLKNMEKLEKGISLNLVYQSIERVYNKLKDMSDKYKIMLADEIKDKTPQELVKLGLEIFSIYGDRNVISLKNDSLIIKDAELLLYYRNRIVGYDLYKEV